MSLKSLMNKFWSMLLFGIVAIVVGVLIFIYHQYFVTIVMIAGGIGAVANGIYTLTSIKRWHFDKSTKTLAIIKGILITLLGLAAILVPMFVAQTAITILVYAFAIGLVFSSIVSFQNAAMARSFLPDAPIEHFIFEGVIGLLLAIILFTNPTAVLTTFAKIVGILVCIAGVASILWAIRLRKLAKNATVIEVKAEVKDAE